MRRERRRLQAHHIWEKIEPDWPMIRARVWTKQATDLPYDALHRRLFLHDYTEESRWLENSYRDRTFFFPALPDKCETWSVNNWNEPVIENKFPQRKKPTTNPTNNNKNKQRTHTSQGTSQAKQSGKFAN